MYPQIVLISPVAYGAHDIIMRISVMSTENRIAWMPAAGIPEYDAHVRRIVNSQISHCHVHRNVQMIGERGSCPQVAGGLCSF